ncbi:MAG: hypothetical protein HC845_09895 [Akkermansiaceae bacterium]|nr:hypothetical protein [Akkermansiaceae bacterium]
MDSARQWNGFVCPDCRLVFRVPGGCAGGGVVCPSCKRLLRIPGLGDQPPLLPLPKIQPLKPTENTDDLKVPQITKQRRRHPKKSIEHGSDDQSWESETTFSKKGNNRQSLKGLIFGAATLALLLILGGILLLQKDDKKPVVAVERIAPTVPVAPSEPDEKNLINAQAAAIKVEPLVRKFLSAKTVDEILPLVRNPQVAESRIKNFYPEGKMIPFELAQYNLPGTADSADEVVSIYVRDRDFKDREIALIATPEGYKIDWESWIGWSEISVSDFMAKKPENPKTFRVTLSEVKYYNFDFTDDSKWTSYRIGFPNQESLYGYVEKDSILHQRIKLQEGQKQQKVILSLKYPPEASRNDQVLVHDLLSIGWVDQMKPE